MTLKAELLSRITQRYSEPHRRYHNMSHIGQMFNAMTELRFELTTLQIIAIYGHDLVYHPSAKDNEEKSAREMISLCDDLTENQIVIVKVIIMSTKSHVPFPAALGQSEKVIDLDLSILASNEEDYKRYVSQVRQEYYMIKDEYFNAGRKEFLKEFLKRDKIFQTTIGIEKLEQAARDNMMAEAGRY